ncbi:MAG: FHA domain-containing protein [Chloroflexota bacterium]|jgi:hypothetical protein
MSPNTILLILRLLGAAVLLAFLIAITWLSYQDLKSSFYRPVELARTPGSMRIVASENPADIGSHFILQPITSIGRSAGNTIVLEDDFASQEHALIILRGEQWFVEDLDSRNGTSLNDVPVTTTTAIISGDVITVGRTSLKLEL